MIDSKVLDIVLDFKEKDYQKDNSLHIIALCETDKENCYEPIKAKDSFNDNYIEYKSNNEREIFSHI